MGQCLPNPEAVGSAQGTTAEALAQALALAWLGTTGHCLKSQLTVSAAAEEYMKVAESVMFSVLKIEQKILPQKSMQLWISGWKSQSMLNLSSFRHQSTCQELMNAAVLWSERGDRRIYYVP